MLEYKQFKLRHIKALSTPCNPNLWEFVKVYSMIVQSGSYTNLVYNGGSNIEYSKV